MKTNSLLIIFFTGFFCNCYAQRISLSPFAGFHGFASRSGNNWSYEKNVLGLYQVKNTNFEAPYISPLNLGFTIDYRHKKNIFSTGVIFGDEAQGGMKVKHLYHPKAGSASIDIKNTGIIAGVAVLKVPFDYQRILFEKYKSHVTQNLDVTKTKKFDVCLFSGINLIHTRWIGLDPQYKQPFSWGPNLLPNNDTIEFVGYSYNYNHKWSVSFKLGTSFNLYRKNGKPWLNGFVYYEQGTRDIGAAVYKVYINYKQVAEEFSISRCSGLNFKLAFPITIYTKKKKEIND